MPATDPGASNTSLVRRVITSWTVFGQARRTRPVHRRETIHAREIGPHLLDDAEKLAQIEHGQDLAAQVDQANKEFRRHRESAVNSIKRITLADCRRSRWA